MTPPSTASASCAVAEAARLESLHKLPTAVPALPAMSKVFSAMAVSVDGYITGHDPRPGHGLGDGGQLFSWYGDGDTRNREVYETLSGRVGASLAGRTTYDDSEHFGDTEGPHTTRRWRRGSSTSWSSTRCRCCSA